MWRKTGRACVENLPRDCMVSTCLSYSYHLASVVKIGVSLVVTDPLLTVIRAERSFPSKISREAHCHVLRAM